VNRAWSASKSASRPRVHSAEDVKWKSEQRLWQKKIIILKVWFGFGVEEARERAGEAEKSCEATENPVVADFFVIKKSRERQNRPEVCVENREEEKSDVKKNQKKIIFDSNPTQEEKFKVFRDIGIMQL
jgi:hypothetical protein